MLNNGGYWTWVLEYLGYEHIKDLMLLLKQFYYDFNDKMNELLTLGIRAIVMNNKQKKQEGYIIKYKLRIIFFLNGSLVLALPLIENKNISK